MKDFDFDNLCGSDLLSEVALLEPDNNLAIDFVL